MDRSTLVYIYIYIYIRFNDTVKRDGSTQWSNELVWRDAVASPPMGDGSAPPPVIVTVLKDCNRDGNREWFALALQIIAHTNSHNKIKVLESNIFTNYIILVSEQNK